MNNLSNKTERHSRAATLLPAIVGALLVAIVAIFIVAAPNQVVSPSHNGYLSAGVPVSGAMRTAMR